MSCSKKFSLWPVYTCYQCRGDNLDQNCYSLSAVCSLLHFVSLAPWASLGHSIWEIIGQSDGGLSVLRTFRLLRVLKLVRFMPALRRQLVVLMKTMDNVATFCMLLMLFIFIFRWGGSFLAVFWGGTAWFILPWTSVREHVAHLVYGSRLGQHWQTFAQGGWGSCSPKLVSVAEDLSWWGGEMLPPNACAEHNVPWQNSWCLLSISSICRKSSTWKLIGRGVTGGTQENLSVHFMDSLVGRRRRMRANENDGESRSEGIKWALRQCRWEVRFCDKL